MSALPESLFGTYKRYKDDTKKVATWLAETALSCGYRLQSTPGVTLADTILPSSTKLKGRARTLARKAQKASNSKDKSTTVGDEPRSATVVVSTADFISFAECITSQPTPGVSVPIGLIRVLERLIKARKRCNSWFERNSKDESDIQNNASHSHFIQTLELTLATLAPHCSEDCTIRSKSEKAIPTTTSDHVEDSRNRFENLSIDDTQHEEINPPAASFATNRSTSDERPRTKIELKELQDKENLLFACFCVLQDLNDLRKYLRDLWRRYEDGKVPLVTASLTANAGVELARLIEEELWQQYPDQQGYVKTFVQLYFKSACAARQQDPGEAPEMGGKYTYLLNEAVADLSEWCFQPMWTIVRDFAYADDAWVNSMPASIIGPLSSTDCSDYELSFWLDVSLFFDMVGDRVHYERRLLGIEDQLTRGIRIMSKSRKEVPLWLAFAARVQVDMRRHVTQDHGRELRQVAARAKEVAEAQNRFFGRLCALSREEDADHGCLDKVVTTADKILTDTDNLYTTDPLLCGLTIFSLLMLLQYNGLYFVDEMDAVLTSAHLYNTIQRESSVKIGWPDMEHLIGVHSARHIFVGDTPVDRTRYWRHLLLAKGASITNFVVGGRSHQASRVVNKRELMCKHSYLCRSFIKQLDQGAQIDLGLEDMLLLARVMTGAGMGRKVIQQDARGFLSNKAELRKKVGKEAITTLPSQQLARLERCVRDEMPAIYFDYVGMNERCWELLRMIRTDLENGGFMSTPGLAATNVSLVPIIVLCRLDTQGTNAVGFTPDGFVPHSMSDDRLIGICAERMANFLATRGSSGIDPIRSVIPSYIPAKTAEDVVEHTPGGVGAEIKAA